MKYEEIRQAMIAAMKAHDKPRKEALSSLMEAIKKSQLMKDTGMISRMILRTESFLRK